MKEEIKEKLKAVDSDKLVDAVSGVLSSTLNLVKEVGKVAEVGIDVAGVAVTEGAKEIKAAIKKASEPKEDTTSDTDVADSKDEGTEE